MANNRRLPEAGKSKSGGHQDKYAHRPYGQAEIAPSVRSTEPEVPFAMWRQLELIGQNRDALKIITERLQPVIEESGEATFIDPDNIRFKILGASAVQRAMYLTKNNSTGALRTALRQRLSKTAGHGLTTSTTTVKVIRSNEHRPTYIHVGLEGTPLQEMQTTVEIFNAVYGRPLLGHRPFASFGIATIEDSSQTPDQLTSQLSGIEFGDVMLSAIEVPSEYQPIY